jgi:hypothetical protein
MENMGGYKGEFLRVNIIFLKSQLIDQVNLDDIV